MKKISFLLITAVFALSGLKKQASGLTVAVAANMQYAVKALQADFEKTTGNTVAVVIGSSGNLTQQITLGAPFDIFISADTRYPQTLYENKLAADSPKVYAKGVLVLWSNKPGIKPVANLKFLAADGIKAIAVANPKTAPYGAAAEEIMKNYNLYNTVQPKIVYGESITQTSQFIASGAADVGFTAKAIVLSNEMKGKGQWVELNAKDYSPISQAAVLLKYGLQNHPAVSRAFYDYLYSNRAKSILKQFGYLVK